jgi:hypothetical protein
MLWAKLHQIGNNLIFAFLFRESHFRMMIRTGFPTGIRTCVDAQYSYRTEIRIAVRFAANWTAICMGNCIRVDGLLRDK